MFIDGFPKLSRILLKTAPSIKILEPKEYLPRDRWSAIEPLKRNRLQHPVQSVYITSAGSANRSKISTIDDCLRFLKELQRHDIFDLGYPDIAYNFYVGVNGKVYEGRGWENRPSLSSDTNLDQKTTLAIAYIKELPDSKPTEEMIYRAKTLIDAGLERRLIYEQARITGIIDGLPL